MIPNLEITTEGVNAPSRAEVQAGLWEVFKAAFGSALTEDDRTPQGQLITSLTAIINDRDNATVELANNFDPRYARGVFQEALGEVYFTTPREPTFSIVRLEFMGTEFAEIPEGTVCTASNSSVSWITVSDAVIDETGLAHVDAQCSVAGAVLAAPLTITEIETSLPGIDRVENPASAVEGSEGESRWEFEQRRAASVAKNAKGLSASVFGQVSNLPGVISSYVIDNPTDSSITIGSTNYPMIRNSLLVSVVGGDPQEIAKAILTKGGTGCSFVGNTEVTYYDNDNFETDPPEYTVKFERPEPIRLYVQILISNFDEFTRQLLEQTRTNILAESESRIASTVFASKLSCAVPDELDVVSIKVSRDNATWVDFERFGVDEISTFNGSDITVSPYE